jgi:hypothetical protein
MRLLHKKDRRIGEEWNEEKTKATLKQDGFCV